ncbi:TonB-dependent receptor domain-containing protein [Rheinheimera sp.]|uniref:TonB-dependent receptor domain-containing protein n=1 Tax=Rheinheimera sp. TaxID=1869214 RepID=UPI0027353C1E|nr:TonB-dependent receptor [Rheinheimera sp.]MDP2713911.1 TonB-dependent receptor [Rheinheimera sp.]
MFKPALAAVLVASCFPAIAENIEHISIYANRTATPQQDVLASVTVLERDDIVARQANDLSALLAQLPGINLARNGGRGQLSSIFVRGGETKHTLVLIDGVRSGSATAGAKSLAMLPLELIERIEVIRGPRAAWYGSDALAGVIAITTRRAGAVELNANVGSDGQAGTDISLSHTVDQLTVRATAGASRADGYNVQPAQDPDRDGYNQKFIKVAADYQTGLGLWTTQVDVNSGYYEFDTSWGTEDQADTLNRTYLLGWGHQIGAWQHQAQLSRQLDRDVSFGPVSSSPFNTERDEFNYQTTTDLTDNLGVLLGVNWYQEEVAKAAPNFERDSRTNRAVFTGVSYQLSQLKLEAAARQDNATQYGSNNTWQLAAGYQFNEHWALRASRGSAFKAPTFNDLYFPGSNNPDLLPEHAVADELALDFTTADTQVSLAWFNRDVTNLIQWVIDKPENIAKAGIEGIEFSVAYQWQQWSQSFAYTWLDARDKSSDTRLLLRPENSINWRGSFSADDWSAFITADYQSRTRQPFDWATGSNFPDASAHTLWGVGASYTVSPVLVLRAKVDNLFDKDYYTNHGFAAKGTNFGISVSYTPQ